MAVTAQATPLRPAAVLGSGSRVAQPVEGILRLPVRPRRAVAGCRHARTATVIRAVDNTPGASDKDRSRSSNSGDSENNLVPMLDPGKAEKLWEEVSNTEQLGKRGEGFLLAQLAVVAFVAFPPEPLEGTVGVLGVFLAVTGAILIFLGQRDLGYNLTPLPVPREESTLVTDGIYALCRHPMYGGLLLGGMGLACATEDSARFVMALLLYLVLENKAKYEETQLAERYGQEYEAYNRRTTKFFPYLLDSKALLDALKGSARVQQAAAARAASAKTSSAAPPPSSFSSSLWPPSAPASPSSPTPTLPSSTTVPTRYLHEAEVVEGTTQVFIGSDGLTAAYQRSDSTSPRARSKPVYPRAGAGERPAAAAASGRPSASLPAAGASAASRSQSPKPVDYRRSSTPGTARPGKRGRPGSPLPTRAFGSQPRAVPALPAGPTMAALPAPAAARSPSPMPADYRRSSTPARARSTSPRALRSPSPSMNGSSGTPLPNGGSSPPRMVQRSSSASRRPTTYRRSSTPPRARAAAPKPWEAAPQSASSAPNSSPPWGASSSSNGSGGGSNGGKGSGANGWGAAPAAPPQRSSSAKPSTYRRGSQ